MAILALQANLTTRNISLRMGVWMGLVIAFAFYAGVMMVFSMRTGERLSLWSVLVGNLFGIVGMKMYLWHRYPSLGRSFEKAPLGSEIKPPPHPPEVS
jgi:ABC-type Mn2+/Zn2+ transport system permease subunit